MYKGRLADGSLVAVKRLKEERTPGGELQFQTEVEMISMAVHRNLLRLRGFCMTPTERLLVYPYMANGSVASCLRGINQSLCELVISFLLHLLCLHAFGFLTTHFFVTGIVFSNSNIVELGLKHVHLQFLYLFTISKKKGGKKNRKKRKKKL